MFRFKTIAAVAATAALALLAPLAAGAKEIELTGPTALAGAGFFGGELTMAMADGQRPVKFSGRIGYVGFLDLDGDLKVRCSGKGRVQKKETDQGTVYLCAGRAGHAMALGSHFKLRGFAGRYRALLPEGVSGSFHGRFAQCVKGDEGWQCERPQRAGAREEGPKADEQSSRKERLAEQQAKRKERMEARKEKAQERKDGRAERKQERKDKQQDKQQEEEEQDEEVPSLAELAALLAGK